MRECKFCKTQLFWFDSPVIAKFSSKDSEFCDKSCLKRYQEAKVQFKLKTKNKKEKYRIERELKKEKYKIEREERKLSTIKEKQKLVVIEIEKIKKKSMSIHDLALLVKKLTNELKLEDTLKIIPMLTEVDHINEVIDEKNNKLRNKYSKHIKAEYINKKVDISNKYFKKVLKEDLERCMSLSHNEIKNLLGIPLTDTNIISKKIKTSTETNLPQSDKAQSKESKTRLIIKTKKWKDIKK